MAFEDLEAKYIDYKHESSNNKVFTFVKYGTLASLYLNLARGVITLNEAKLDLEDFKNEIKELETKRTIERTMHNE